MKTKCVLIVVSIWALALFGCQSQQGFEPDGRLCSYQYAVAVARKSFPDTEVFLISESDSFIARLSALAKERCASSALVNPLSKNRVRDKLGRLATEIIITPLKSTPDGAVVLECIVYAGMEGVEQYIITAVLKNGAWHISSKKLMTMG